MQPEGSEDCRSVGATKVITACLLLVTLAGLPTIRTRFVR